MKNYFQVGLAINKFGNRDICWLKHGMIRVEVSMMKKLFDFTVAKIIEVGIFGAVLFWRSTSGQTSKCRMMNC
jgi:hypothetical protein